MRSHHPETQPPERGRDILPNTFTKRMFLIVSGVVLLFIGRNLLTRDYTGETKTFLTSIGRADAIEKVVPKTLEDVQMERKKQISTFDQLVANMTIVMSQYQGLRADVDELKGSKGMKGVNGVVAPVEVVARVPNVQVAVNPDPPATTKYLNMKSD